MMRRAIGLLLLGLTAGCSSSPAGPESKLDMMSTGSIVPAPPIKKTVVDAVAPSDWERIRLAASTSIPGSANGAVFDWTNAETGSNGTISPVAVARTDPDGRNCRPFALTVSDVRGIRRYRGDACRATDGMWQLFNLIPEDSTLL